MEERVKTIYVDADACPVKDEVYRVATRYRWRVFVVANTYIQTPRSNLIFLLVVGKGEDVADDAIAERVEEGDIVVTADIPLAARTLEKGGLAVGPRGKEFLPASIGDALAGRELSSHLREMGVMTGGPPPMGKKERSRFLGKLDELIQRVRRAHPE